jgi:glyoxylase-like metal-dependent hydrolase (beta-lactamase superfamily II)
MAVITIDVGDARLTRVGYVDVDIPPESVGLSAANIATVDWSQPIWAQGDQLRAGAAAWIIKSADARIVVDPALAADEILRNDKDAAVHQHAFASLLADAGFARETMTHAVATHVEGIGMFAWRNDDGTWSPFFSNAPLLASQRELDALDRGEHPDDAVIFRALRAQGVVRATGDHESLTNEVTLEHTGGHSPGHQVLRISSRGEQAIVLGHLATSALHLETGPCPRMHNDGDAAWSVLSKLRDEGALLVGPLWPAPGAGHWDGSQFVPAE